MQKAESACRYSIWGGGVRWSMECCLVQSLTLKCQPNNPKLDSPCFNSSTQAWAISPSLQCRSTTAQTTAHNNDARRECLVKISQNQPLCCCVCLLNQVLSGHSDEIFSCAFNYEGDSIITGSKDNTCRIWRVADEE